MSSHPTAICSGSVSMRSLRQIFDLHGCDRGHRHGYERVYEPLLAPLRHQEIRILEIGVLRGAGIESWLRYFPHAHVVGIDLFTRVSLDLVAPRDHRRVELIKADSTYPLPEMGMFDLIFDDGDHSPETQRLTFENYYPTLAFGGTYFIEDVRPDLPGYDKLIQALPKHAEHYDLRPQKAIDSYVIAINKC